MTKYLQQSTVALILSGICIGSAVGQTVSPVPQQPSVPVAAHGGPEALSATSAAPPAQAAPVVAQAEPVALPTVVVVGHYDTAVGTSDAASQGVVSGAALQDIPLLRPGEVLETVPGLVVTQHSGDGKANQYFLRGYNLDHGTDLATTVDGVPVNMPTNAHGHGYTDLNFLIPELIDHINYRKGPYWADYGDFSAAGAVDVVYRTSLNAGMVDLTAGQYSYYRMLAAQSGNVGSKGCAPMPNDPLACSVPGPTLLGAVELLTEDGPWTTPENLHKYNGLLRLSDGTAANGWAIDGIAYSADWASTDQVPLELIQSGELGRFSALDPTDGGNTGRVVLSGQWHQSDADGYANAGLFFSHYHLQLWSNFTFFELRPETGDQFEQEEHRNFLGGQVVKGWNLPLFGYDSTTEVGAQLRHDHIDVGLFNSQGRVAFQTVSDEIINETTVGVFAQSTTEWAPWFRSIVGLRQQNITMSATAIGTPENSGSASGHKLLPKLSLIFGPWNRTEFFINAGEGFHSNDARGVIDAIDPTTGLPSDPVPALVSAYGKEIGMRTEAVPGLQTSLALWSLNSDSELVYSADSDIGSTSPNAASSRYGIEFNNHLIVNPNLLFDLDYAWTHARYDGDMPNGAVGNYIPNAVSQVATFRVTLQNYGPWTFGLKTRFIGAYPLSQDGSLTAPSSSITDVRFQNQVDPSLSLTLDVLNIFNRKYYDIAYEQDYRVTPTSPIVPSGVTVHPGEPRQLRATLNLRF